jgi:hypothetical protein
LLHSARRIIQTSLEGLQNLLVSGGTPGTIIGDLTIDAEKYKDMIRVRIGSIDFSTITQELITMLNRPDLVLDGNYQGPVVRITNYDQQVNVTQFGQNLVTPFANDFDAFERTRVNVYCNQIGGIARVGSPKYFI